MQATLVHSEAAVANLKSAHEALVTAKYALNAAYQQMEESDEQRSAHVIFNSVYEDVERIAALRFDALL